MNECMRTGFRRLTVALGVALAAGIVQANDWYVDPTVPDDSHDGTSSNIVSATVGPKRTLAGVMAAGVGVGDGDTVWLLPGEHKEGTMNGGLNRLYVTQKNLKVKSLSGNPFDTSLVGNYDVGITNFQNEASKWVYFSGAEAVSCVKFAKAATDCIIEGVMMRDATARFLGDAKEYGGGIYDLSQSCWAINCVFSNCCAMAGGGMYCGSAARCRFIDCSAAHTSYGAALHAAKQAAFCLFQNCDCNSSAARGVIGGPTLFVNCTMTGAKRAFFAGTCTALNSISIDNSLSGSCNGGVNGSTLYATNSLFGSLGITHIDESGDCVTNQTLAQIGFVSPETGDWHVWDSFDTATFGDARHLQAVALPEGYEHRDLYGDPVPAEGVIPAGCALARHQTFGTIVFKEAMSLRGVGSFAKNASYHPTETSPFFFIESAEGDSRRLYSVNANVGGVNKLHYPLPDGSIPFEAPSSPDVMVELTPRFVTDVRYADPVNGNDNWDGTMAVHEAGTDHGPKETLQAAFDVTTGSYPLVLAAAGVYSNGVTKVEDLAGAPCLRRLVCRRAVGIRAVEGPDKTFLVGAPDPETGELGTNAVAGVYILSTSYFQGFTVTGCYTPENTVKAYQDGAAFSGGTDAHILDCVASNNVSYEAAAARYVTALRCRFVGNKAHRFAMDNCIMGDCLIANNTLTYSDDGGNNSSYAFGSTLYGCTIDMRSPAAPEGRKRFSNDSSAYGCILVGYRGTEKEPDCFTDCVFNDNLVFADPEALDYRLGALSSAIGAVDRLAMSADFLRLTVYSMDGSFPNVNDAGRQTAGAYQKILPCVVLGPDVEADGLSTGTNVLKSVGSGQVTFTVNASNLTRPYLGMNVGGVFHPLATSVTCDLPGAGETLEVAPVFGTDWYVDAATGSDSNGGGVLSQAKKTIRAASTNAVSGDVIHVVPGTYGEAEGSQKHDPAAVLESRVILADGVTLESLGSAADTFIVGSAATTEPDADGNGFGAVRCACVGAGSRIRGFTLTGGHTCHQGAAGLGNRDILGSAVYNATSDDADLEDCVVSNNFGYSATLERIKVVRCRVLNNLCQGEGSKGGSPSGSAGRYCSWHGCIIDGCIGNGALYLSSAIESCTIGSHNAFYTDRSSMNPQTVYNASGNVLLNSVLLGGRLSGVSHCTNCVLPSSAVGANLAESNCLHCVFLGASDLAKVMDDNLRPVEGSVAVDFGDTALLSEAVGETDLFGVPRVLNGQIDAGAAEFDWRPTYAKRLGSRITVTSVSPDVTNSTEGVAIPSGELAGTIGRAGSGLATFEITGNGILSVYVNGVLVGAYASGETSAELGDLEEGAAFRFLYAPGEGDAGAAVVKGLRARMGMLLIVR